MAERQKKPARLKPGHLSPDATSLGHPHQALADDEPTLRRLVAEQLAEEKMRHIVMQELAAVGSHARSDIKLLTAHNIDRVVYEMVLEHWKPQHEATLQKLIGATVRKTLPRLVANAVEGLFGHLVQTIKRLNLPPRHVIPED